MHFNATNSVQRAKGNEVQSPIKATFLPKAKKEGSPFGEPLVAEMGFDIAHVVEVRFVRRVICYLAVRTRQMTQYATVATADIDPDSAGFLLCDFTLIYKVIFCTE